MFKILSLLGLMTAISCGKPTNENVVRPPMPQKLAEQRAKRASDEPLISELELNSLNFGTIEDSSTKAQREKYFSELTEEQKNIARPVVRKSLQNVVKDFAEQAAFSKIFLDLYNSKKKQSLDEFFKKVTAYEKSLKNASNSEKITKDENFDKLLEEASPKDLALAVELSKSIVQAVAAFENKFKDIKTQADADNISQKIFKEVEFESQRLMKKYQLDKKKFQDLRFLGALVVDEIMKP